MKQQLLEVLRCPIDHSRLALLEPNVVDQINRAIAAGALVNLSGSKLQRSIDGGLVREAGDLFYPIVDQIPVMLPDEAIDMAQLNAGG